MKICTFSEGIGYINGTENGRIELTAKNFQIREQYEFRITAWKGERSTVATLILDIKEGDAPLSLIRYEGFNLYIK